jgi:hypothetical protein
MQAAAPAPAALELVAQPVPGGQTPLVLSRMLQWVALVAVQAAVVMPGYQTPLVFSRMLEWVARVAPAVYRPPR